MNENLNLVEILKNVPGTKLWSPICGDCMFVRIDDDPDTDYPIVCSTECIDRKLDIVAFTANGVYDNRYVHGCCALFPSEKNRDWSTFKISKKHKHFEPFQKVLVGLIMNNKQIWTRDVYMCYRKDVEEHCTVFESMVPDELIIPYDADKDGKPVKEK